MKQVTAYATLTFGMYDTEISVEVTGLVDMEAEPVYVKVTSGDDYGKRNMAIISECLIDAAGGGI